MPKVGLERSQPICLQPQPLYETYRARCHLPARRWRVLQYVLSEWSVWAREADAMDAVLPGSAKDAPLVRGPPTPLPEPCSPPSLE